MNIANNHAESNMLRDRQGRIVCGECAKRVAQVVGHWCNCPNCNGRHFDDIDHGRDEVQPGAALCFQCADMSDGPDDDFYRDEATCPYLAEKRDIFEELDNE